MKETKRVLVTVKTYPHPSQKHRELVCVAGVQEDGSFIRLYPVPFRYLEKGEQFAKYQWIELQVVRNSKDRRSESFRIVPDTIRGGENFYRRELGRTKATHFAKITPDNVRIARATAN